MDETLADLLDGSGSDLFDRGVPVDKDRFQTEVGRIASGLAALGIKPSDRVAVWLPNGPAWLTVLFAVARLGAIVVSVNTRFRSHELGTMLRRSQPSVLIYWPRFSGIDLHGVLAECDPVALTSLSFIVEYAEAPSTAGRADLDVCGIPRIDFAALPAASAADDLSWPSAPCMLFSTSGTTKEPKLVLHDQLSLVRHARNVATAWRLTPDCAVYLVPPMCGVFGLCTALAALAGGVPLWMRPVWDPSVAATEIVRGACTHITGTDDAFAQLLAASAEPTPYPTLVYAGFAAFNPALTDIVVSAERRGLRLSGLYGTSEMQALFSIRKGDGPADERCMAGGYPVDSAARVRARDPVTGVILQDGMVGDLEILAPQSRMVGYFGDDVATAAAFTDDGWYRTGDLGRTTEDGGFIYLSRTGDSLRLGGFLVSPIEVEAIVQEVGNIEACQVVAVPLPEGMRAVAFVIPAAGSQIDEDQLTSYVRARLASYKVPVRFFPVDKFPVTVSANGTEIRKDALRQLALEHLDK